MAPRKPIKTYTRKSSIIPLRKLNSVELFDALVAGNLSKRKELLGSESKRKRPITIKELPEPDVNHYLLHDSTNVSFNNADDTFDKLRKEVPFTNMHYKHAEPINNSTIASPKKSDDLWEDFCKIPERNIPTPRNEMTELSLDKKLEFIDSIKLPAYLDETVNESLCVESETDKKLNEISSLSIGSTPCRINGSPFIKNSRKTICSETSKNVTNSVPVIASTPATLTVPNKLFYTLQDTISPILALKEIDPLLLDSYKEISDWNYVSPFDNIRSKKRIRKTSSRVKVKHKNEIKNKLRHTRGKKATPSIEHDNIQDDWKLAMEPRIELSKCPDVMEGDIVKLDEIDFHGWPVCEIEESILTGLTLKNICDIYEKCLLARSERFLSNKKSPKSSSSIQSFSENKRTSLNCVSNMNEVQEALPLDGTDLDNSASLFSPEISKTPSLFSTSKSFSDTSLIKSAEQENELEHDGEISFINEHTPYPYSLTSTPLGSKNKRPVQIEFNDFEKACNSTNIYDRLEAFQNDHSYASVIDKNICVITAVTSGDDIISIHSDEEENTDADAHLLIDLTNDPDNDIGPDEPLENNSPVLQTRSSSSPPIVIMDEDPENSYNSICDNSSLNISEACDQFSFAIPKMIQHELRPGKSWRRSLLNARKSFGMPVRFPLINHGGLCTSCTKCTIKEPHQQKSFYNRRISVKVLPEKQKEKIVEGDSSSKSILENYAAGYLEVVEEQEEKHDNVTSVIDKQRISHLKLSLAIKQVKACDVILERCGQVEPLPFLECYPSSVLKDCRKIGEGVYGEVFEYINNINCVRTVMKIIPIEGKKTVNGEHQKKYEEIISEIIICMELSNLRNNTTNCTFGFSEVYRIRCVRGSYPSRLVELWDIWDKENRSENDSPTMFKGDQLYIILELAHGGHDMEEFDFRNSQQALSLFKQMAYSLAVAESALKFEHRDLHWGNVLISSIDSNKTHVFHLDGREFRVPSHGVQGSIIDFTLSRITYDGVCIYNDLSLDPELFVATGDYQFEIYRLMQKHNGNKWSEFNPYTNVLWLHYAIDKMISEVHYRNQKTKIHGAGIKRLEELKRVLLEYKSVKDLVYGEFVTEE